MPSVPIVTVTGAGGDVSFEGAPPLTRRRTRWPATNRWWPARIGTRSSVLSPTGTGSGSVCEPAVGRGEEAVVDHRLAAVRVHVDQLDVEVRLGRVERGPEGQARMSEQHLIGGERRGGEGHHVHGLVRRAGLVDGHGPARVGAHRERAVTAEPELDHRTPGRVPAIELAPSGAGTDRALERRERRLRRDRDVGHPRHPAVEPRQQDAGRHLRGLGRHVRPLVVRGAGRPRRLVDERDREEVLPRSVHRPRTPGHGLDVREGAGPEVAVLPAADREDRDREVREAPDERPVAPEPVEGRVLAVGGVLRVGIDHAAGGQVRDVGPVVDLAALGRLDATGEHHVVVEGRRRLHGRDRDEVLGTLDRRAVAGLATEALAEHPDAAVGERLRGEPLDQVVRVATRLPEAPVVPPSARIAHPAEDGDERVVPARGEEVGLAEVEVAQHHVRRELHDDAREPTLHRHATVRGAAQLAGDRDPVAHRDLDRRPDDVVRGGPFVGPPRTGRG